MFKLAFSKIKLALNMIKFTLSMIGLTRVALDRPCPGGRDSLPPGEGFSDAAGVNIGLKRSPGGRYAPSPGDSNGYKRWGPFPGIPVVRKPPRDVDPHHRRSTYLSFPGTRGGTMFIFFSSAMKKRTWMENWHITCLKLKFYLTISLCKIPACTLLSIKMLFFIKFSDYD